jgi:hypothetical protein
MSQKLSLLLHAVTVRRDANTITPINVPEHEFTVLRVTHGKENVVIGEPIGTVELNPDHEFERLSNKYGQAKVVKVYGDDDGVRLSELVEKGAHHAKTVLKGDKRTAMAAG